MTSKRNITLANQKQLQNAAKSLSAQCAIMQKIYAEIGTPPLRDFTADFAGLAKIITGQQLSIASASAIWKRVFAAIQPFDAARILTLDDAAFATLGLSRPKIRTLKAVASAIALDGFDIASLALAPDDVVIDRLTSLHGVGPWTADIYLLFALRRADAFPAGDLALQLAVQRLMRLEEKPTPAAMIQIAERWRPWRGAAARLLWAEYGLRRGVQKPADKRGPDATPRPQRLEGESKKSIKTRQIR